MHQIARDALTNPVARGLMMLMISAAVLALLLWIVDAYLGPGLRKAIIFSGFAMC